MNEENWIETIKMRKHFKKLLEEIFQQGQKIAISDMKETTEEEWKAETRENYGKERG